MSMVFADTAFYIAFVNRKDRWHEKAASIASEWRQEILTTEYVLVELGNHLCHPEDRNVFLRMMEMIQQDNNTHVVAASSEHLQAGLQLYGSRMDKQWSLTDCISFSIMRQHGITDALTCDRHFVQAGFRAILLS